MTTGELLITGITRNTLLAEHYGRFERCLRGGGRIRFLLVDPASAALATAAERYYAVRDAAHARGRIAHTLGLLRQLQESTGGAMAVRTTGYPLSVGVIAADDRVLYVEYYTYRTPGEPKFVLEPHDRDAYKAFRGEAEELWRGARPVDLAGTAPAAQSREG